MSNKKIYTDESALAHEFTDRNDILYSKIAKGYDLLIKTLPVWENWITQAIPHIQGRRVLEVSFGTGLLLTKYAADYETYGIDYNSEMVKVAKKNLQVRGIPAQLMQGNVETLPYDSNSFDTILNTMAFTGYPDSKKAMSEMVRVLKPDGKIVMVDINYPKNMNFFGKLLTKFWIILGDIIRDMDQIFGYFGLKYTDKEIGGFGSVHLYIARKGSKENRRGGIIERHRKKIGFHG